STRSQRQSLLRVAFDRSPLGGCHQAIDLLKPPACCRGCIGTVPNSHHVLIMLSSRNVSGALDSPVSATDAEINTLEERKVREECYHLHRLAPALQVAGSAGCLVCPEPRSRYHHCLGRRSDLEDMGLAGGGV